MTNRPLCPVPDEEARYWDAFLQGHAARQKSQDPAPAGDLRDFARTFLLLAVAGVVAALVCGGLGR